MKKILFVCLGNICRSPMAEAIFNYKVKEMGLASRLISDSAGTAGYHIGESPDPRTIETVTKNGISIKHLGQQFNQNHGTTYDYIIAMDTSNKRNILDELNGSNEHKVYLMRDFDPIEKGDVPDPYYGGKSGFSHVFEILSRSIDELIVYIRKDDMR